MTKEKLSTDRFRSATDFPKSIADMSNPDADYLYQEMRDCLIFTNRSRAQLIRRNEEHKQTTLVLKEDVARLQQIIHSLALEKQSVAESQQLTVQQLQEELQSMTGHLDLLAKAFEEVEDVHSPMNVMAIPGRFARFWQALRALIIWWREESEDPQISTTQKPSQPSLSPAEVDHDRRENPQMYSDPASNQRSLHQ